MSRLTMKLFFILSLIWIIGCQQDGGLEPIKASDASPPLGSEAANPEELQDDPILRPIQPGDTIKQGWVRIGGNVEEATYVLTAEGQALVEGDILVEEVSGPDATTLNLGTFKGGSRRWSSGIIPYFYSSVMALGHSNAVIKAIDYVNKTTNLRLVPIDLPIPSWPGGSEGWPSELTPTIRVVNGGGCYSYLGRTGARNYQSLGLSSACGYGSGIHEFFHAAGLTHEQNIASRSEYLSFIPTNLSGGWVSQFSRLRSNPLAGRTLTGLDIAGEEGSWDMEVLDPGSIMMYYPTGPITRSIIHDEGVKGARRCSMVLGTAEQLNAIYNEADREILEQAGLVPSNAISPENFTKVTKSKRGIFHAPKLIRRGSDNKVYKVSCGFSNQRSHPALSDILEINYYYPVEGQPGVASPYEIKPEYVSNKPRLWDPYTTVQFFITGADYKKVNLLGFEVSRQQEFKFKSRDQAREGIMPGVLKDADHSQNLTILPIPATVLAHENGYLFQFKIYGADLLAVKLVSSEESPDFKVTNIGLIPHGQTETQEYNKYLQSSGGSSISCNAWGLNRYYYLNTSSSSTDPNSAQCKENMIVPPPKPTGSSSSGNGSATAPVSAVLSRACEDVVAELGQMFTEVIDNRCPGRFLLDANSNYNVASDQLNIALEIKHRSNSRTEVEEIQTLKCEDENRTQESLRSSLRQMFEKLRTRHLDSCG